MGFGGLMQITVILSPSFFYYTLYAGKQKKVTLF